MKISKNELYVYDELIFSGFSPISEKVVIKYTDKGKIYSSDTIDGRSELRFPFDQTYKSVDRSYHVKTGFFCSGNYSAEEIDGEGNVVDSHVFTVREADSLDDISVIGAFYERTSERDGYAGGNKRIRPGGNTFKPNAYVLRWADGNGDLDGYSPLAVIPHRGPYDAVHIIPEDVFFPEKAGKINISALCGSRETGCLCSIAIKHSKRINVGRILCSAQILSDIHLSASDSDEQKNRRAALKSALSYISESFPDSKGIFISGDNVNNGLEEEYKILGGIFGEKLKNTGIKAYFSIGNHEKQNGTEEIYEKYLGIPNRYYTVPLPGALAIMLSGDLEFIDGMQFFSEDELSFLDEALTKAEKENVPAIVFSHHPFLNSVAGALIDLDPDFQIWGHIGSEDALRKVLVKHRNFIYFTGHTHWCHDSVRAICRGEDELADCRFVNVPSFNELWDDQNTEIDGNEGFLLDVTEKGILLRGFDFAKKELSGCAHYFIER